MPLAATLNPREVAELSGATKRLVEKAIEERVLAVGRCALRGAARPPSRVLLAHAVAYAAILARLELRLTGAQKKRLASNLAHMQPAELATARLELTPAVELDAGRLIGDAMDRAERYRVARDTGIVADDEIMGGTPVIRGTRITVYSVLGRVENGDTIDDILAENPHLSRPVVEAAVTYARTHPFVGRPGGRPWAV